MLRFDDKLPMSPYYELYDMLVKKDDKYRKVDDLVDFSFIRQELENKYCHDNGRGAIDPVILFKYLVVKSEEDMSDRDLVERSRTDLSVKRFLGYMPEDEVIDSSTLTVFRRQRLKDVELLEKLLAKTVAIAREKGVLKSRTIIVDGTHTSSLFCALGPRQALTKRLSDLIARAAKIRPEIKGVVGDTALPEDTQAALDRCESIIEAIEDNFSDLENTLPGLLDAQINNLRETMDDIVDHYYTSEDSDARIGHKSRTDSFNGYKTHLAMNDDRIITAAIVTTGEKSEGAYLESLVEQSRENGADVDTVIGDGAYSTTPCFDVARSNEFELVSKQAKTDNTIIDKCAEYGFEYNKDSDMMVCPAGHQCIERKDGKTHTVFYFDKKICKVCKLRDVCKAMDHVTRSADPDTVPRRKGRVNPRIEFCRPMTRLKRDMIQETPEFKEKYRQRYKIEAKNAELKNNHHYDRTISKGIQSMTLQAAVSLFVVNLKRIGKLMDKKEGK